MELLGNNDANYKLFFMHKQKKKNFSPPVRIHTQQEEVNGRKNYENSECNLSWRSIQKRSEKKNIHNNCVHGAAKK